MGKLKVGFVLDDTLDTPDGVQQYILALGKWLSSQGHDVHYLVGHTTRQDIPNVHPLSKNLKVQFNGNRMSTPLPARRREISQLLAREQFDVLHVQIPYSPFMAQRVIMAAPPGTAVVGTFHIAPNSLSVEWGNKVLSMLVRRSLRRFDAIFSVSQAAADFAHRTYGIATTILPNVVKADHFRQAEPYVDPTPRNVPKIVYLGRLVPRKGCQILLEAVKQLKNDHSIRDFEVIVCGGGPLEAELKRYVTDNDLGSVVSFTGYVDDNAKARYLKAADIAVFPSTGGESFGIVLLEAMAAEHPVVLGAENAGYKTVLAPYPELLFPVHDPLALADKLKIYLVDRKQSQQALIWQKTYVRQFDVAVVGRRLIARYTEVLRQKTDVR